MLSRNLAYIGTHDWSKLLFPLTPALSLRERIPRIEVRALDP